MNCNLCTAQFDHTVHVPRLLIFCGHSLCQLCCQNLHSNNRIECPQCQNNTFIEEVNFLPKNLALLKVNNNTNCNTSNSNSYCLKHEKKYEAFCKKQKQLICVDCILHDSHRNHEMDSIKNAYTSQEISLKQTIVHVSHLIQMNKFRYEQNIQNEKISYNNFESTNQNLMNQFMELKQLIDKQQQNIINKIKQQYAQYQSKIQQKNGKFKQNIENLSNCLNNLQHQSQLSEIQFLFNANERLSMITNINNNVEQSQKILNLMQPKNITAENIIKSIQKNFKIPNNLNQLPSISKPPHNNSTKSSKKSTNQPSQNIKLLQANQNSKPMAKKQYKKQIIAVPYSSNSILSPMIINSGNPPLNKSCVNPVDSEKKNVIGQQQQKIGEKDKFYIGENCDVSVVQQKQSLFNSFLSSMTNFLTQQKYVYTIGGFDEESRSIIRLNLTNYQWQQVSSLKTQRSKFGCAAVQKNIYILGGKKGRQRVSDIEIWNNGNWKTSIPLKKKRSGFAVISHQQLIYIIGGNDGENILNSVQVLNTVTGDWSRAEPMAESRDELAACIGKNNKIYVIGGFGGKNNEPLKSMEIYDVKEQKWYKGPSMSIPRRALAAAALADGIYAIGGFDGTKHLNSVQKYEEGDLQWVRLVDLNRGRCTHSAVSIFETQQIIVMGGFDQQALDSVQKYSLIANQWEEIAKMPSPRFMHASVLFNQ